MLAAVVQDLAFTNTFTTHHHPWVSQRTLTIGENITVQPASILTGSDRVILLLTSNNIFSCLVESNSVKLNTSHTMIQIE